MEQYPEFVKNTEYALCYTSELGIIDLLQVSLSFSVCLVLVQCTCYREISKLEKTDCHDLEIHPSYFHLTPHED